jgi:hypothetical protein
LDEFDLHTSEVGTLSLHDEGEELISQSVLRNCEVDEGGLCLYLGGIVGVRELCMEEQFEVLVDVQFLTCELYLLLTRRTDDELPRYHGH